MFIQGTAVLPETGARRLTKVLPETATTTAVRSRSSGWRTRWRRWLERGAPSTRATRSSCPAPWRARTAGRP